MRRSLSTMPGRTASTRSTSLVFAPAAERELERAVRLLVEQAARDQRVRRLEGLARARRAGRDRDSLLAHQQHERFALDALEAEVRVAGQPLCRMAVEVRVRDRGQDVANKPVTQRGHVRGVVSEFARHDLGRRGHADDACEVLGARAQTVLLTTAEGDRRDLDALAEVERADALRAVDVVAGERQHPDTDLAHVDGELALRRDRVRVQGRTRACDDLGYLGHPLDSADLVARPADRDEDRLGGDALAQLLRVDAPELVGRHLARPGSPPSRAPCRGCGSRCGRPPR